MDNPKVSAIITTHNRLGLLKRAVDSVFNQTCDDIELIVVDDNSTDGTDAYCKSNKNITYLYIPATESKGGNHARNIGISNAKGEYIAFLDDDDYWKPTKIEKQLALAEKQKKSVIYCGFTIERIDNGTTTYKDVYPSAYYSGDVSKKVLFAIFTATSNIFVRKDILLEVGLFDEELRFWQEYELCIRLAQNNEFYFVNEPLTVYRIDKSDTKRLTNKYDAWLKAVADIQAKHKEIYNKLSLKEKLSVKQLIWSDARMRCENAGLKYWRLYYNILIKLSFLPKRFKSILFHFL